MKKTYTIYKITCVYNKKSYIGMTSLELNKRWNYHKSSMSLTAESPLHRDMHIMGLNSFIIEELGLSTNLQYAYAMEEYEILSQKTLIPRGYNRGITGKANNGQIPKKWIDSKSKEHKKYFEWLSCTIDGSLFMKKHSNKTIEEFEKLLHTDELTKDFIKKQRKIYKVSTEEDLFVKRMQKINEFMKTSYSLDFTIRYSMCFKHHNESVASHSFFVSLYVYLLSPVYFFNVDSAVIHAILHDLPEIKIDDLNHKVKKDFPELAKVVKDAEKQVISTFPSVIRSRFQRKNEKSVELLIVKLADTMQCTQYALSELSLGNKDMETIYYNSLSRIKDLEEKLKPFRRLHTKIKSKNNTAIKTMEILRNTNLKLIEQNSKLQKKLDNYEINK